MHAFTCQSYIAKWDYVNIWLVDTLYNYISNLMHMANGGSKEKDGKKERRDLSEFQAYKREMKYKQKCVTRIKVGNF